MQAYFERGKGNGKKRNSQIHAPFPCVLSRLQSTSGRGGGDRHHPSIHLSTLLFIMGKQTQGEKKRRKEKEKWLSQRNQKK